MRGLIRLTIVGVFAAATTLRAADPDLRLVEAAKAGRTDAVHALLDAPGGASRVNAAEPDGTTPLHWAVQRGDLDMTRLLLHAGANAGAANRYGATPLTIAALGGSPAIVGVLLASGVNPNVPLPDGQTPLMLAARLGNPAVIDELVTRGADLNARERVLGETALIWAAAENHGDAIRVLAAHGAEVDARSDVTHFPRRDYGDGKSGRFTVLPRGGWTPLMYAARQDARDAIAALAGAGADLNLRDPDGTTALVFAVINAHYDAAALLLEKGADPNVADVRGMTPLYAAIDMNTPDETPGRPAPQPSGVIGALDLARTLLADNARPDAALIAPVLERVHNNGDAVLGAGATPLMRAARKGDVAAARLLLDLGADPRATMKNGANAVMIASGFGGVGRFAEYDTGRGSEADFVEIVRLCLARGADINAADAAGRTAVHAAAAQRSDGFIRFLAGSGAHVDVRDADGRTPIDVALGVGVRGRGGVRVARESTAALLRQLMNDGGAR